MEIWKDRDFLNEDGSIPIKLLVNCIDNHRTFLPRYEELIRYYNGEHKILARTFDNPTIPNNKLVCNHAEYITDIAVGYVFGAPISYTGDSSGELNNLFTEIEEDSHNNELALDISIFGVGYELLFMNNEDKPKPQLAVLSPSNTFLVYDTTVEHKAMFAVTYFVKEDIDGVKQGYNVSVYTENKILSYFSKDLSGMNWELEEEKTHSFGGIPIISYKNNKKSRGDFEGVISLIDAYNKLQSDRINDKEQLVNSFLVISGGQSFGDDEKEVSKTVKYLNENKIIELDENGKAEWLVKQLNEDQTEVLKKALKDDIHEFSRVPCLTDENFVGNSSGVAMKYKLIGFEGLGKTKERYFKQGLRQRLKLIANIYHVKSISVNPNDIDINMERTLPVDDEMLARISEQTDGFISWETRVRRFDGEIDVEEERKRLEEDNKKKVEEQQKAFGSYSFKDTNLEDGKVDEG